MKIYTLPGDIPIDKKTRKEDIIFYHYTSLKDSFKEKAHLNCNAFSLVISGSKIMHFAEKTVNIRDSEIHLLSAGNCIASVSISKEKTFESVLIFFKNEVLADFYLTHSTLIGEFKPKRSHPFLEFEKDEFIRNYIQSLLLTLQKNKEMSASMKQIKLQELFLYLLENYPDKFLSFKHSSKGSDLELQFRNVIEANKDNNLTLEELSFLCNMSVSTFKRKFKQLYNTTPSAWLNEQRMMTASRLLRQRGERPGEIWHKLGFETHTGFTKSFKKHFGCTPKEFTSSLTLQE